MSLINDALKRAKEAQQEVPLCTPNLPLRPVEPGQQHARHNLGLLLPVALAVVALLALFLVWQLAQTRPTKVAMQAVARTTPALSPPAALPTAPPLVRTEAALPAKATPPDSSARQASASPPMAAAAGAPAANPPVVASNTPVADAQESVATNAAAVSAIAPPKPAPLRLQGIVFNPQRPSAMISGRTVFIGDKVGGLRVVAIDQDSTTLVGAGQTNILSLSD